MKSLIFYKKIVGAALIVGMVIFSFPKQAKATLPTADVANTAQNTISAAANTTSAASSYSLQIKEYVLDNIAYALAKMILREITTSVVNWINSGFDGNPAFVSNPGEFFKGIGDELLGSLIEKNGDLNFLCSPFSIDIRLALAFKYRPFKKRISCTLSDVIKNSTGAIENASINGFTAGNFSQGGWPAFVSMTTEPQNNIYGAYVEADYELSARIAARKEEKRDELNQGRGFLSWRKCHGDVASPGDANFVGPTQPGEGAYNIGSDEQGPVAPGSYQREKNCEVQTPGSVIAGVLDSSASGPLQDLHLADEINEVVNALFAQLVTKVLTVGLKGVSGKGASDPDSYIKQIQNEQVQTNQQLQEIKNNILQNIDKFINKEVSFKEIKNISLGKYIAVKNKLDTAKNCYITKLQTNSLSSKKIAFANERIGSIESTLQTKITNPSTRLLDDVSNADENITTLKSIKQRTVSAQTVNDVAGPSKEFASITGSQTVHSDKDILEAQTERDTIDPTIEPLHRIADQEVQRCNLFPNTF